MATAGRKMMRSLRYRTLNEMDGKILVDVLQDAFQVKD